MMRFVLLLLSFFFVTSLTAQQCAAAFSYGPTGLTIDFFDQSTVAPGDQIISWAWDFEEGGTSSQQNPTVTFPDADKYDVSLTITTANGCTSTVEVRIETCVLNVSYSLGDCTPQGTIPLSVTINDAFDSADEIDVLLDGSAVPGGPFPIDAENPVTLNLEVAGNGLEHLLTVLSADIETCMTEITFSVPDCTSDCFLGSLSAVPVGGTVHDVNVGGDFFAPVQTTITVGDLVRWTWIDGGHTTTSDATAGPDSWNSGLRGNGATFDFRPSSPGVHQYYCVPHGAPGGVGMAGRIIANCPPAGLFDLNVSFTTSQAAAAGYDLLLDGVVQPGSPFNYVGTGPQSVILALPGDGQPHLITIRDVADPSCDAELTYQAPDCGAAPSCQLSLTATETVPCNAANQVGVELVLQSINAGNAGYELRLDGAVLGTFTYAASGTTTQSIDLPGDGQPHTLTVTDLADGGCTATTTLTTTDCSIPCGLTNLAVSTGGGTIHQVEVRDFDFFPPQLTIAAGDRVEWVWTGQVPHTTTSDAETGADSWASDLLGNGATFLSPVLSAGVHPYYCVPHGAPGGVGMAGTVTVAADCDNGQVAVNLSFTSAGVGAAGYVVSVDGNPAGTFAYTGTGLETAAVLVPGDGQPHTITVADAGDASCAATTTITTPDCDAPTCQLANLSATETGGCAADQTVPVELSFTASGGAAAGYELRLDGAVLGTFAYAASGTTTQSIDLPGDGQPHTLTVTDLADGGCTATTTLTTTDCSIPCGLTNLAVSTGGGTIHQVEVRDFDFFPPQLTIAAGDRVEWVWTGQVPHTTTSDAETGADSWASDLLGNGATFLSPVLSTGVHPYYCVPHGAPGGVGMAGTVTVAADCDNGQVAVNLSFTSAGVGAAGYVVSVDGNPAGTFAYTGTGLETAAVLLPGDGQSHTITVADADDASCAATTTITTPDCDAPTCQLANLSATETGGCAADQTVPVELSFTASGGAAAGYELRLDGAVLGTFAYAASGTTTQSIDLPGDGQPHTLTVTDLADGGCTATTTLTTTDCSIPCGLTNLAVSTGGGTIHQVEVRDFDFFPPQLTIAAGDRVEWVWTGQVPHTTTSDAETGADSWASDLLGNGATFLSPVLSAGVHPYYCVPHGAPGGVGMAGTVTVAADCDNGQVAVNLSFASAGVGAAGYVVSVDGNPAGTFAYTGTGLETAAVLVPGDGQLHTITVADADDASCAATTTITTPDCDAPTCQLANLSATETGGCAADQTVPVELSFTASGGAAAGYELRLDGAVLGTFAYAASGTTTQSIDLPGDGQPHTLTVTDLADGGCTATTTLTTTDCSIPCGLTNLAVSTGGGTIHQVEVRDFDFFPPQLTIAAGDRVEWVWTGQVPHTTTSDAETGADSWASDLLGNGATFLSPVLSAGVHPYYCVPHGAPGGVGMAGTVTVAADCDNGQVAVNLSFASAGVGAAGYVVSVDGNPAGTFAYTGTGLETAAVLVPGDGQPHTITVADAGDASCAATTTITTPDCNAPTCQLANLSATETGGCAADQTVPVELSFTASGGAAAGYELRLDGAVLGTFAYAASGTTTQSIDLPGDGQPHTLTVTDLADGGCTATTTLTTTDCSIPCGLSDGTIEVVTQALPPGLHRIDVRDFDFLPLELDIAAGDTVEWVWTGQVPHTVTSDAETGADSWDSGLLGNGATFRWVVTETGEHPYYCIPHGAPGGIGMAGLLRATEPVASGCTADGRVPVRLSFGAMAVGNNGFGVLLGDSLIYTGEYQQGTTTVDLLLPGTGEEEIVTVFDQDDPACSLPLAVTPLLCPTPGTCDRALISTVGNCSADGRVPVTIGVAGLPSATADYLLFLDGTEHESSPLTLNNTDSLFTLLLPALGQEVLFELIGTNGDTCSASTITTLPDCGLDCAILDLSVVNGRRVHRVEVRDFDFFPADLTVTPGDTITFVWTGQVPHTATSDATTGPDSWASELFGFGATFSTVITEAGDHPYYCVPHGGPGGIGMAGMIRAVPSCDTAGRFNVPLSFGVFGGSPAGYRVFVDGALVIDSVAYQDLMGSNTLTVSVPGDGALHRITLQDRTDQICAATVDVVAEDCSPPAACSLTDLDVALAAPGVTTVLVRDFDFSPRDVDIRLGDTVRFVWTGQIPHTATSDDPAGPNSWDSGLLGEGAVYDLVLDSTGFFPYYCIPHGGPGGIGMAGSVTVTEDCAEDDTRTVTGSFRASGERGVAYGLVMDGDTLGQTFDYVTGEEQSFAAALPAADAAVSLTVFDLLNPACSDTFAIVVPACSEGCADVAPAFTVAGEGEGLVVTFTDSTTGPATSWLWGFGDGSISREQSPVHEYATGGTYEVCLLVQNTDLGCNAVYCEEITVGPVSVGEGRQELDRITLWPNPVAAGAALDLLVDGLPLSMRVDARAEVIGADGRVLPARLIRVDDGRWRVRASRVPAGMYTVMVSSAEGYFAGRLVVQ